jgi:hypothetical protein
MLFNQQAKRYLTPATLRAAAAAGLELAAIDTARPLEEQGPFDAILHKLGPDKGAWLGAATAEASGITPELAPRHTSCETVRVASEQHGCSLAGSV